MTVCIQCGLKALVEGHSDTRLWTFDESPEQHMARCHPNMAETHAERERLVKALHGQKDNWN